MTLYEINKAITDHIDMETGEILDTEALEKLWYDRDEKLCNIALLAKNKAAEVAMIKAEEDKLKKHRQAAEKTLAWCKETLKDELKGEKLKDECGRFTIYYRSSHSVKIKNFDEIPKKWVRELRDEERERLVDKNGLKLALEHGEKIPGVALKFGESLCIK